MNEPQVTPMNTDTDFTQRHKGTKAQKVPQCCFGVIQWNGANGVRCLRDASWVSTVEGKPWRQGENVLAWCDEHQPALTAEPHGLIPLRDFLAPRLRDETLGNSKLAPGQVWKDGAGKLHILLSEFDYGTRFSTLVTFGGPDTGYTPPVRATSTEAEILATMILVGGLVVTDQTK